MTLYARFAAHVDCALDTLEGEGALAPGLDRGAVAVEPPRDPAHGDLDLAGAAWRCGFVGSQDGDPKRSGLLMTKEQFRDFELRLDFMIDERGKYNSGVYLRGRHEVQIEDSREEEWPASTHIGGVYGFLAKLISARTIARRLPHLIGLYFDFTQTITRAIEDHRVVTEHHVGP